MHKKEFEIIASVIHELRLAEENNRIINSNEIIELFAERLAETNALFNSSRFKEACKNGLKN